MWSSNKLWSSSFTALLSSLRRKHANAFVFIVSNSTSANFQNRLTVFTAELCLKITAPMMTPILYLLTQQISNGFKRKLKR